MGLATRGLGPLSPIATNGLGVFGYIYVPVEPPSRDRFPGMIILPGLNDTERAVLLGLGGSLVVEVQNAHSGDMDIDVLVPVGVRAQGEAVETAEGLVSPIKDEAFPPQTTTPPITAEHASHPLAVSGDPSVTSKHDSAQNPNRQDR
jgi:hypothetical protein